MGCTRGHPRSPVQVSFFKLQCGARDFDCRCAACSACSACYLFVDWPCYYRHLLDSDGRARAGASEAQPQPLISTTDSATAAAQLHTDSAAGGTCCGELMAAIRAIWRSF